MNGKTFQLLEPWEGFGRVQGSDPGLGIFPVNVAPPPCQKQFFKKLRQKRGTQGLRHVNITLEVKDRDSNLFGVSPSPSSRRDVGNSCRGPLCPGLGPRPGHSALAGSGSSLTQHSGSSDRR